MPIECELGKETVRAGSFGPQHSTSNRMHIADITLIFFSNRIMIELKSLPTFVKDNYGSWGRLTPFDLDFQSPSLPDLNFTIPFPKRQPVNPTHIAKAKAPRIS